jgi:ABC-type molybdenum transport system ATPase subunit/photorepair protein PhrA
MTGPELLLLDEPCQGLDSRAQNRFLDLVDRWTGPDRTLIYVTHRTDEVSGEFLKLSLRGLKP